MIQTAEFWIAVFAGAVVYWHVPLRLRAMVLSTISILYLAHLQLAATLIVGFSVVIFWFSVRWAGQHSSRRFVVVTLIGAILAYLAWYKYLPVLMAALSRETSAAVLLVPLGLSYFTFKLIHYTVEMRRGSVADHSFFDFLSYMMLFPIFTAGPIERIDHFLAHRQNEFDRQLFVEGVTRIIHGLIKKFVIAGIVLLPLQGALVGTSYGGINALLASLPGLSPATVWLYCLLTLLILYMDFSAYSDIAIGASRLFGIRIMENFNLPIIAGNMAEYWKRWHMTLATWCQSYVYMPVFAMTRNPYAAVYSTFLVMGLWHGASWNWVAWGLYHATGVATALTWGRYKRRLDLPGLNSLVYRRLANLLTLFFVAGSMTFAATAHNGGIKAAGRIWSAMIGL